MWSSIIVQENNFVMPGVVVSAFFLECSAQSQLCLVESSSNGFVRFEQLIIHQADLTKYTMSLFPRIFGLAVDVEAQPDGLHDFLFFELS